MKPRNSERVEALRARKAQIEAEISRLQATARSKSRKADTRKKILIGALILQEMERRQDFDAWVRKLLAEGLTKNRDRALFDLPPLPPASEEPA